MIIDNSAISLSAQHQASRQQQQSQSLQLFQTDQQGNRQASVEINGAQLQRTAEAMAVRVNRQDPGLNNALFKAEQAQQQAAALPPNTEANNATSDPLAAIRSPITAASNIDNTSPDKTEQATLDPRTQLIKAILERMLGKSLEINGSAELATERSPRQQTPPETAVTESSPAPIQIGMRYQSLDSVDEFEQTTFQAQGKVRTRDGREIDFTLGLSMTRHFSKQQSLVIEAGARLKDPLVINFDGKAAELHDNRFTFDLDADGEQDQIHQLASHSGMLALDKNGDGTINDGSELFGALSGDGFADLQQYDQDGNDFIDEADSVFNQLQVWVKDDQGNDQLLSLRELGVGALYLGSTDTPFDLKGSDNELQGRIRATGVYLSESGHAGTLQQLDLVV
ncbi:MAG: hypothetical protein V7707_04530 [Motiliproteus sp.]